MNSSTHILPIALRLFYNGCRFRLLRLLRRPGKIKALSIEITHRCVCKCVMCNIWKISKDVPEMDSSNWEQLLANPLIKDLVELDITGGEPFLVDELPAFFSAIREKQKNYLPALRSIAITTNGVLTAKVISKTRKILQHLEDTGIQLVLACAMDGFDATHDRIRGVSGSFEKMQATLQGLFELREKHPALILGIKTTIVPLNVDQLDKIQSFADRNQLFSIISPCIITDGRFLNSNRMVDLAFTQRELEQIIEFFQARDSVWGIHDQSIFRFLTRKKLPKKRQCSCGFHYAFIRSTGEVHLCPLLEHSAGSLQKISFKRIWYSKKAKDIRGRIGQTVICSQCTEPGLERYSLVNEGWAYLRLIFILGPRRFARLHSQLGLQNYFHSQH